MNIVLSDKINALDKEIVENGLKNFNRKFAPEDNRKELIVFLKNEDGEIKGGIIGGTYWDWMYIETLWIEESFRGGGYGLQLLEAAEKEAVRRGCKNAHLDTHDFQALGFYQKNGYEICGQLDNLPQNHTRYLLKKNLIK